MALFLVRKAVSLNFQKCLVILRVCFWVSTLDTLKGPDFQRASTEHFLKIRPLVSSWAPKMEAPIIISHV